MKKCINEEKLIKSALSGNTEAFGELVRHYEKFVFNVAISYMSSYDDAFDVAQDSFIKAWQKLSLFKGESSFSTWLYRICSNTAKDALDKRAKTQYNTELDEHIPDKAQTPEEKALQKEAAEELNRALRLLDTDMREIIVLRELEELSYSELSEQLGIEIGTVKSRLSRARQRLREILSEQKTDSAVKINEKKEKEAIR